MVFGMSPAMCPSRGMELLVKWQGGRQAKEVCEVLGVDRATYSRFVNGVRKPSGEIGVRIERATRGRVPATSWYEQPRKRGRAS